MRSVVIPAIIVGCGLGFASAFGQSKKEEKPAKGQFLVPAGFRVETVVPPTAKIQGDDARKISFVNMCFDAAGRLLLSQEGGPILLVQKPTAAEPTTTLEVYCNLVTNCQGMCGAHGALYLVGNGPQGTGLYRVTGSSGKGKADKAELLLKFKGGMGEHGPHAVIHGPDDRLYVVIGNHSWADVGALADNSPLKRWPNGLEGADQGKPGSTEDVLLPRLNDANGHAANRLAPGGTIWRLDVDGKNPALVAAGFRNHFDAAFNPAGELFTFDSDMEWDVGLPWYRHVRVAHCPPGADFVWRTGAANTPNYYIDSLPPLAETGRGSPTGVECYDHSAYPAKYRGALFLCDWSIGTIWVAYPKREGAGYKAEFEKFCTGSPMPVSDCAVGPDGALYFTLGGRGTQGGVHRIVAEDAKKREPTKADQPLAAWSEVRQGGVAVPVAVLREPPTPQERTARAVYLLGIEGGPGFDRAITPYLNDADPFVRRLACDACVRQKFQPDVKLLRPMLAAEDRFLRTAARLVLQTIDPAKWAETLIKDADDRVAHEAIVALCKIDKLDPYAKIAFERLHDKTPGQVLEWARTVQLALMHTAERPPEVRDIAAGCLALFPHSDPMVNRELAILLTEFARIGVLEPARVVEKLLAALRAGEASREQQIHLFYCLRLIHKGWTREQKLQLVEWFEGTRTWTGGASFAGFLMNILKDAREAWTLEDRQGLIGSCEKNPLIALAILRFAAPEELPAAAKLFEIYQKVGKDHPKAFELKASLADALGKSRDPEAPAALRKLASIDPAQKVNVARALARTPAPENFPVLIEALPATPGNMILDLIDGLRKNPFKPKADDPVPFRAVLDAVNKVPPPQRWKAVELLRHWTNNKSFGAEKPDQWQTELVSWGRWFGQTFPKEKPLPDLAGPEAASESKYKLADLAPLLDKEKGDPAKGRLVFAKANCIKCHKFGSEGEGVGPDLSQVSKRFKRSEILESILYPSKVISDQYRSSKVTTLDGRQILGLLSEQGNTITIVLPDASRVTMKADDIESRVASLVSVMPDKLLDGLTKEEIVDLFAFMDAAPPETKP